MKTLQVAALIAVAVVCAAVSNVAASASRRLAWIGDYPNARIVPKEAAPAPSQPARQTYPPHPESPWVDIAGDEAAALYRRAIPFLDARRTSVYAEGHIAGARSLPVWESTVDDGVKRLFDEGYDVNAPLVVYCSGGDCEDSHMLAQRLHGYGFNNALVYTGGFPDWQKRGLPVEKGLPK